MANTWVCIDCGARQAAPGTCAACGKDEVSDARDDKVRELMHDVDERLRRTRETHARFVGVLIGMFVVFGLWMIPAYWDLEEIIRGPGFIDQWALMAAIGYGVMKLLARGGRKRFPYLRDDLTLAE
nr:hypothetical protein [Kofleriaceae bacterium]